ncbi:MAG: hypothetical protein KC421_29180 [Anaerolineales bacterium]|nr:hypothetical protein [Anaerolineales bacterium]
MNAAIKLDYFGGHAPIHEGLSDVIISCFQEYFTESKNPQITSLLSDLKTNLQAMIKRK